MAVEIRPAREDEMAAFKRVALRSLMIPPEIAPPEAIDAIRPEWTLCAFENGRLATAYAWWPLKMRFNGASCPMAGVTYVGTHPVYRRRGHLRKIVSRHFENMHEKGQQPFAVLHASRAAIYHRYGYAVVSSRHAYSTAPRHLEFARTPEGFTDSGSLRELEAGQRDVIKDLYQRFCSDRTGYIHRARAAWDAGVLAPPPENGALFQIVYEADGIPEGYVIYTARPGNKTGGRMRQKVFVRDLAWLSARAYDALWRHLSGMDLADEIQWARVPPDDPLPHLVSEPAELNTRVSDGIMARIVDVGAAVSQRRYSTEGSLCFDLVDDLCPWNRGRWRLEITAGRAEASRTRQAPEIILPVDTLAMLIFGQISASRAAEMGRLEVCDPNAPPAWDNLLKTQHPPFCPDFF